MTSPVAWLVRVIPFNGPPSREHCSQIHSVSNEMQVHQMQVNLVIPHITLLKYHPFTTSTIQRLISPLYHSCLLKHTCHNFHALSKWWVLDNPHRVGRSPWMLGSTWTWKDFPSSSFVLAFYGRDHFNMWLFLTVYVVFMQARHYWSSHHATWTFGSTDLHSSSWWTSESIIDAYYNKLIMSVIHMNDCTYEK